MYADAEVKAPALPWFLTVHWAWVLFPSIIETLLRLHFGWGSWPFQVTPFLWSCLQAAWLRSVYRRSNAIFWYSGTLMLACFDLFVAPIHLHAPSIILALTDFGTAALWIVSIFVLRHDIVKYFLRADGVDLRISRFYTFVFNAYYFQHQFRWIAEYRRSNELRITPAAG